MVNGIGNLWPLRAGNSAAEARGLMTALKETKAVSLPLAPGPSGDSVAVQSLAAGTADPELDLEGQGQPAVRVSSKDSAGGRPDGSEKNRTRKGPEPRQGTAGSPDNVAREQTEQLRQSLVLAREVAANLETPLEVLGSLVVHPDPEVRRAVAGHRNTDPYDLDRLSMDREPAVRRAVAGNRRTDPLVLKQLAYDPEPAVRRGALGNQSLPQEVIDHFHAFVNDPDPGVRQAVAANRTTAPIVLCNLADDPDPGVRQAVAANRTTEGDVLSRLADDPNPGVRQAVAANRNTPQLRLSALASDLNPEVRRAAAGNRRTLQEALRRLADDPNPDVRETARRTLEERERPARESAERQRSQGNRRPSKPTPGSP